MFIKNPNLPNKKVKSVLIDYRALKTKLALEALGIKVYTTPKADIAYSAISGHPDIAFHLLDENSAIAAPQTYDYYCSLFGKKHIIKGKKKIGASYPDDSAYNAARIGKYFFHNEKITDKTIFEYYKEKSINLINVKQGYTKCSICIVAENAIITEDKKAADAAVKNGFDSLLITPGNIRLRGFPYGFIGGSSGKLSDKLIAFNGNIEMHRDYDKIKFFCSEHNVEILSLTNDMVEDIGSIIPIE